MSKYARCALSCGKKTSLVNYKVPYREELTERAGVYLLSQPRASTCESSSLGVAYISQWSCSRIMNKSSAFRPFLCMAWICFSPFLAQGQRPNCINSPDNNAMSARGADYHHIIPLDISLSSLLSNIPPLMRIKIIDLWQRCRRSWVLEPSLLFCTCKSAAVGRGSCSCREIHSRCDFCDCVRGVWEIEKKCEDITPLAGSWTIFIFC